METVPERRYFAPLLDRIPGPENVHEPLRPAPQDAGGAWRPDWRMQDPSRDPTEPYGGESSGVGNDHGWANCNMVAAALAYAYHVHDQSGPQGGDFRHHQDDLSGGTDLYDARTAWDRYGNQTLTIKSGQGWDDVVKAHNEGRAIVILGEGNVPGNQSFDGCHSCVIAPETQSDGDWLFGDPLATGWQWIAPSQIKSWAERMYSGINFAVSKVVVSTDSGGTEEPAVPCPPCPECPYMGPHGHIWPECKCDDKIARAVAEAEDKLVQDWYRFLNANPDADPAEMYPVRDAMLALEHQTPHWDAQDARWRECIWPIPEGSGYWDRSHWDAAQEGADVWGVGLWGKAKWPIADAWA